MQKNVQFTDELSARTDLYRWWMDIISYQVDGGADKGFFRLQYTDQTATNLDNADFNNDGLTYLQEITPVIIGGRSTQTKSAPVMTIKTTHSAGRFSGVGRRAV